MYIYIYFFFWHGHWTPIDNICIFEPTLFMRETKRLHAIFPASHGPFQSCNGMPAMDLSERPEKKSRETQTLNNDDDFICSFAWSLPVYLPKTQYKSETI